MDPDKLFGRILIGVDGGETSAEALALGFTLARWLHSKVECVHAVELPLPVWSEFSGPAVLPPSPVSLAQARQAVLPNVERARTVADYGGPEAEDLLHVVHGHPAQVLLDTAERLRSELVVLGKHDKRFPFDFGSTARALVSRLPIPVWVQKRAPETVHDILVAVDFSPHSWAALEHAQALADRLKAKVRVVHVYTPPAFAYGNGLEGHPNPSYVIDAEREAARKDLAKWMETFPWGKVQAESEFCEGEADALLVEKGDASDLVVLGTHGRTGLSRFFLGSVANGVVKRSSAPVLVVPRPKHSWLLDQDTRTPSSQGPTLGPFGPESDTAS